MKEKKNENFEEIELILKKNKERIRKKYNVEILGIFGSYSREEASEKSDVDILVRFDKGASLFKWASLVKDLEKKLGISVDVVPEKSLKKEIKPDVSRDLIKV